MSTATKNPKDLMEYRYLGRTGLRVSVLSFGAWVQLFLKKFQKISSFFR
jgi:predicted aldo/keto reductase-like oxidoreductase